MSYNFKTEVWKGISEFSGSRAYPGVLVVCVSDKLKYFTKGSIYQVEKILENPEYMGAYKLKMKGIKGFVLCDNFNLLCKELIRETKIADLIDVETTAKLVTKPTSDRKIDLVEDKVYQLFEFIINRISRDKNYLTNCKYYDFNTLIEIICDGDKSFGLKPEDFNIIQNMNIKDLIDTFIEVRKNKIQII